MRPRRNPPRVVRVGLSRWAISTKESIDHVAFATTRHARERLEADLVVDATGRAGLATRWLKELGCEAPRESKVRIDVTYVSRMFKRTERANAITYLAVTTPPEGKRGVVTFAVEGDRWLVSLAGFMGEQPPEDLAGFIDYIRSLPVSEVHNSPRAKIFATPKPPDIDPSA